MHALDAMACKQMAEADWLPAFKDHPFSVVAHASYWIGGRPGRVWVGQ